MLCPAMPSIKIITRNNFMEKNHQQTRFILFVKFDALTKSERYFIVTYYIIHIEHTVHM